jgi:hypothetical protein
VRPALNGRQIEETASLLRRLTLMVTEGDRHGEELES